VSIHGKNAPPMRDVVAENLTIKPLGHEDARVRATCLGRLGGTLVCAVTGRHLSLTVQAYGGTGNASTIWSTRDINAAGGWVHLGPNGLQYMYLPKHGRFYLTSDGHAIVAHPKEGESPSSAAKRARQAVLDAGWKPSRAVPRRSRHPRAPRQVRKDGPRPDRQGAGAAPRR